MQENNDIREKIPHMQIYAGFIHIFLLHLFFTFDMPLILQGLEAILLFLS